MIVDNLDRIDNRTKPWGRTQQEYLFVDQGEFLTKLNCHVVYTMPLSLKFSNDYGMLTQRFPEDPKVLPMVPVQWPDGSVHEQGMALMQQMILARAFPDLSPHERINNITEIFDSVTSLERLCKLSGATSELRSSPSELRSSPSELRSSPSELRSSPSELRSSTSELRSSPSNTQNPHVPNPTYT